MRECDREIKRWLLLRGADRAPCADCGAPTVIVAPDDIDHIWAPGACEWYMVRDHLWPRDCEYLCVGCLEARLGRELRPADFASVPVNRPSPRMTPRLRNRLGAGRSHAGNGGMARKANGG